VPTTGKSRRRITEDRGKRDHERGCVGSPSLIDKLKSITLTLLSPVHFRSEARFLAGHRRHGWWRRLWWVSDPSFSGIRMPLRQRARSREVPSSNPPRAGPLRSPSLSSDALRSRTVACVPCSRNFWVDPPVVRGVNVRAHHRQEASQAGFRSSSSAAVTGKPPRFKGTSVWLAGRNTAFTAAEIDGSEAFVRNSEVFVITRSYKMRAQ
jgi:hypothetical protein